MAMSFMRRFMRNDKGSTITEYALIGGFISAGLILALIAIGARVDQMLGPAADGLN